MNCNLKNLKALVVMYLDEAQLSDDEDQIIVLCSILDDVEGFEKELRETPLYRFKNETWEQFAIRLAKRIKEILGE